MRPASFILVLTFITVAVFGYSAMHGDLSPGAMGCVATMVLGEECTNFSPWGRASFHISAFKMFSLGVVPDAASVFLFVFALLLLIAGIVSFGFSSLPSACQPSFLRQRASSFFTPFSVQRQRRWQAFHENSPNVFSG